MRPNRASPKPISGYAYGTRQHWQESSDEDWDQELYTPTGDEKYIGVRTIDDSRVNVWRSGKDYIAQLEHMTRNHKGLLRRNGPPPPPVRRKRRPVDPSLRGVRALVEREERPFDPERSYPRETKAHHFSINARGERTDPRDIPHHLRPQRVGYTSEYQRGPEHNGDDIGYGVFENGSPAEGEPQWYEVEYATGSDYSGGTVELSNYRVLKEMLEEHHPEDQTPIAWVASHGGHGTFSIFVVWDELDDEIKRTLSALEDYPLIDESAHSELEMELEEQGWEDYWKREFEKEVTEALNAEYPDEEEVEDWPASDEDAFALFRLAMETSNTNWQHETLGNWPHVDLKRVVRDAVKIVTGETTRDWFTDYDERAIEAIRKGFDLEVP